MKSFDFSSRFGEVVGEIGRAIQIDHGLNAAAGVGVAAFPFQLRHIRGVADHHR